MIIIQIIHRLKVMTMKSKDGRTGPKIRTGPDLVRGPDIFWSGFLVRSVVRIFGGPDFCSGPWSGYFMVRICGPVRGPDFLVRIISTGPDFGPWSG